jgi:putative transposase
LVQCRFKTCLEYILIFVVVKRHADKTGKTQRQGRLHYASYVALGANQGRRPELVGGGLIRSLGGWSAIKNYRMGSPRIKGDERILGGGDFVEKVLREAEEVLAEATRLKRQGVGWNALMERAMVEFDVDRESLTDGRKERRVVRARSILCYRAVRKWGMTVTDVALKPKMTPSAVSRLVSRGQHLLMEGE